MENDKTSSAQCVAESQSKVVKGNEDNNQGLVLVTGGKHFGCKKCEKQFSGSSGLYQHNASVHEGVCFYCEQWEYKATLKYSLKQHVESVHRRISLACDKCDKTFSNRSSLWKYNLSVHYGVHYLCNKCDYKATDTGNLQRHKLKQHNNTIINILWHFVSTKKPITYADKNVFFIIFLETHFKITFLTTFLISIYIK